jgi:hypothetical protein
VNADSRHNPFFYFFKEDVKMSIEIKNEHGHYVVYINGTFYGSYDTMTEAAQDIDDYKKEIA